MKTTPKKYENGNVAALVTPARMRTQKGIKEIIDGLNVKNKELGIPELETPVERVKGIRLRENRDYFATLFTTAINGIELKVMQLNAAAKTSAPESKKLTPSQIDKLIQKVEKEKTTLAELRKDTTTVRGIYVALCSGSALNKKEAVKHWDAIRELHTLYAPRGSIGVGAAFPRYVTADQKSAFIVMMEKAILSLLPEITRSTEKLIASNKATTEKIESHERALATEKRFSRLH